MSWMLAAPPGTASAMQRISASLSPTSGSMAGEMTVLPAGIRFAGTSNTALVRLTFAARSARGKSMNRSPTLTDMPAPRRRSIRLMASSEWPPSAKKRSCRPMRSTPSSSAQKHDSAFSTSPTGGWSSPPVTPVPCAGSALRSSLPLAVNGMESRFTYCAGTM